MIEDNIELDAEVERRFATRKKNIWFFILLAALFGGIGLHRAYLGQKWCVLLYLLLSLVIMYSGTIIAAVEILTSYWIIKAENEKIKNKIREELYPLFVNK